MKFMNYMNEAGSWAAEMHATPKLRLVRKTAPHCNCKQARKAFDGIVKCIQLCPTEVTADNDCIYCGYAAVWLKASLPHSENGSQ